MVNLGLGRQLTIASLAVQRWQMYSSIPAIDSPSIPMHSQWNQSRQHSHCTKFPSKGPSQGHVNIDATGKKTPAVEARQMRLGGVTHRPPLLICCRYICSRGSMLWASFPFRSHVGR